MLHYDLHHRAHLHVMALIIFLIMALVMLTVPARSAEQPMAWPLFAPKVQDVCLPLLNAAPVSVPAPDQALDQASAPAAALGLILGVRYAVGPMEAGEKQIAMNAPAGTDGDRARAIASYRHCRSQQAIQSLAYN